MQNFIFYVDDKFSFVYQGHVCDIGTIVLDLLEDAETVKIKFLKNGKMSSITFDNDDDA